MSISSKIFESVSFKNSNELKEGQKSEEFISQLKSDFSSIADGNTIAGYPTPDGAILNFTIDHKDDSKIAENIDKVVAELYPDYIANTNIDANDILDNVMVELSRKEDKPEGEDDFNEAGANVDLKAGVDIPDDLASSLGTAALMAASEEKECGKNDDKDKLEELDPITVGVIGAGLGAVGGAALTNMAKGNKESEEVEEGVATAIADDVNGAFEKTAKTANVPREELIKSLKKDEDKEVTETTEIVVDDNGDVTVATDEENVTVAEELPCEDGDIACDGEEEIADKPADEVAPETVEPDESSVEESEDVDKEIKAFLDEAYEEEIYDEIKEKKCGSDDEEKADDSEELEEIGPVAAGLLGAAGGAIAGNLLASRKKESEEITEAEEPASQVDFAHTQFEQVTNTIKTISELKAQDTENSLYTDLLRAYDDVQKILKDYINEQPVTTTETPAEAPAEEIPSELPAEEIVDIENTEIEGE